MLHSAYHSFDVGECGDLGDHNNVLTPSFPTPARTHTNERARVNVAKAPTFRHTALQPSLIIHRRRQGCPGRSSQSPKQQSVRPIVRFPIKRRARACFAVPDLFHTSARAETKRKDSKKGGRTLPNTIDYRDKLEILPPLPTLSCARLPLTARRQLCLALPRLLTKFDYASSTDPAQRLRHTSPTQERPQERANQGFLRSLKGGGNGTQARNNFYHHHHYHHCPRGSNTIRPHNLLALSRHHSQHPASSSQDGGNQKTKPLTIPAI